jgi:CRISPR-associated protein Cmr4
METKLFFTHALSPLHAGTGQGIGVIDLPVAKEKSTGLPFLPGSSVKGVSRDTYFSMTYKKLIDEGTQEEDAIKKAKEQTSKYFGPDSSDGTDYASAIQFSDQRLLLLPVRSLVGTFAWITSPYILRRFKRDAIDAGKVNFNLGIPTLDQPQNCLVTKSKTIVNNTKVYLEDLDLNAKEDSIAIEWAEEIAKQIFPQEKDFLKKRFCIVSDEVMSFLVDTALEVSARIKLDKETKTVTSGGLWYEEALPCETLLYGILTATKISVPNKNQPGTFDYVKPNDAIKEVETLLADHKTIQFGGKATVGRGVCKLYLS